MGKFKGKVKKFWGEHYPEIIAFGVTVGAIAGASLISQKSYQAGFVDGGMAGVHVGARWLDKTYPGESNAVELMNRYAKEHPEEIVHWKGPGKWS